MTTILKVLTQQDYDRNVFLTYIDDKVIGINYHQGIDKIDYTFADPNQSLTDIFLLYSQTYPSFSLKKQINESIALHQETFLLQRHNLDLPLGQKELIQKALAHYLDTYRMFNDCPTDNVQYTMFDLMQLQELFNYDVVIKLDKEDVDNFTAINGFDLPIYK